MPVNPNPLDPRPVLGSSFTGTHSRFSMHSRMSCAMQSPVLIRKEVSELLMRRTLIGLRSSESTTLAPMWSPLTASPDLSAILAYSFILGTAIEMPVSNNFRVLGGIIAGSQLYRS